MTYAKDRAELVAALATLNGLIAKLGELSARVHQPGLRVDDAICQMAETPATLEAAIAELDEQAGYLDDLDAGEPAALERAAEESHAAYRDAAPFRVGGGMSGTVVP